MVGMNADVQLVHHCNFHHPLTPIARHAVLERGQRWRARREMLVIRPRHRQVTEGADLAFAHGLLRCGGTTGDGRAFQDLVRATFCLVRRPDGWRISHQHISAPR